MPAPAESASQGLEAFRLPDRTELSLLPGHNLPFQHSPYDARYRVEWSASDLTTYDEYFTSGFVVCAAVTRNRMDIGLHHYGADGRGGLPEIDDYDLHKANYKRDLTGNQYEVPAFSGSIHVPMSTPTGLHGESQIVSMLSSYSSYEGARTPEEGDRVEEGQDISMLAKPVGLRNWKITASAGARETGTPEERMWLTRLCADAEEATRLVGRLGKTVGLGDHDKSLLVGTAESQLVSLLTTHQTHIEELKARRLERMNPVARRVAAFLDRLGRVRQAS